MINKKKKQVARENIIPSANITPSFFIMIGNSKIILFLLTSMNKNIKKNTIENSENECMKT